MTDFKDCDHEGEKVQTICSQCGGLVLDDIEFDIIR